MSYNKRMFAFAAELVRSGSFEKACEVASVTEYTGKKYMKAEEAQEYIKLFRRLYERAKEENKEEARAEAIADVDEVLRMYTEIMRGKKEERVLIERQPKQIGSKIYMTESPVSIMVEASNADRIKAGKELIAALTQNDEQKEAPNGVIILAEVNEDGR